jgi:hypothetical protein
MWRQWQKGFASSQALLGQVAVRGQVALGFAPMCQEWEYCCSKAFGLEASQEPPQECAQDQALAS